MSNQNFEETASAWLLLAVDGELQRANNDGYADDPSKSYAWDSTVPNHSRIRVGDRVALWNKHTLLGVSVVESISTQQIRKTRRRCPHCGKANLKARKSLSPEFKCFKCGETFDNPDEYESEVTAYVSDHGAKWSDLFGLLDATELRAACESPKSQLSLRPLDWEKFQLAISRRAPVPQILDDSTIGATLKSPKLVHERASDLSSAPAAEHPPIDESPESHTHGDAASWSIDDLYRVINDISLAPRSDTPLGELFPDGNWGKEPWSEMEFSVRTANCLRRHRILLRSDLAETTPSSLLRIPNMGKKSVAEIVDHALRATPPTSGPALPPLPEPIEPSAPEAPAMTTFVQSILVDAWANHGAHAVGDVFALRSPPISDGGRSAHGRFAEMGIDAVADVPHVDESIWEELEAIAGPEFELWVNSKRPAAVREPVAEIAGRIGLSAMSARSKLTSAQRRVSRAIDSGGLLGFLRLSSLLRKSLGDVCDTDELIAEATRRVEQSSSAAERSARIRRDALAFGLESYAPLGELLVSARAQTIHARLLDLARQATFTETLNRILVQSSLDELFVPDQHLEDYLNQCSIETLPDGQMVRESSRHGDRACTRLAAEGSPMTLRELHAESAPDKNFRSFSGRIQDDARIVRLTKEKYGLADWGGETYAGINHAISREIERLGGRANLDELISRISKEFEVTMSSVRTYTAAWEFIVEGSDIRLRTAGDPQPAPAAAPIDECKRAFRIDGDWFFRVSVDRDLQRGSGGTLPVAIAAAVGLEPELVVAREVDGIEIVFSWLRRSPEVGTLRALARSVDARTNDFLFIPVSSDSASARVVRTSEFAHLDGSERLAVTFGIVDPSDDPDQLARQIGNSLGIDRPADWTDIADQLHARSDRESLPLLPDGLSVE